MKRVEKKKRKNPGINLGQPAGKGWKKTKKKNPGNNPGQPARKGRGKKKKTLVLTLGRSGAYTANPPEKGEKKKKKKKPWAARRKRAEKIFSGCP